mmetsp:Transcript_2080/g.6763  ORF Transcript_2080/g.6763 Transcript_2080/m.6763 type:complete len:205 (-) Transcript_2080:503-1117(-)
MRVPSAAPTVPPLYRTTSMSVTAPKTSQPTSFSTPSTISVSSSAPTRSSVAPRTAKGAEAPTTDAFLPSYTRSSKSAPLSTQFGSTTVSDPVFASSDSSATSPRPVSSEKSLTVTVEMRPSVSQATGTAAPAATPFGNAPAAGLVTVSVLSTSSLLIVTVSRPGSGLMSASSVSVVVPKARAAMSTDTDPRRSSAGSGSSLSSS